MVALKKVILPEAFIYPALQELEVPVQDEALFKRFVKRYADRLDELWADFLQEEAYERLLARSPGLRTMIRHTTLSNRTKAALERDGIETVGHLAQYSLQEISVFRGIGKKAREEINEYLERIGFGLKEA